MSPGTWSGSSFWRSKTEFDSIHPSLLRHVHLEQQLRALRGHPGHLPGPRLRPVRHHLHPRQDRLDRVRHHGDRGNGSRGVEAVSSSMSARASGFGRDLFAYPWRPLGRRAWHRRRSRRASPGRFRIIAPVGFMEHHDFRERLCRQRHEPAPVLPVWPAAARQPVRLCRPGPRPGRVRRRDGPDRADPFRRKGHRGDSRSTASGWCSRTRRTPRRRGR